MNYENIQYHKVNLKNYEELNVENFLWRIRNDPVSRNFSINSDYIDFKTQLESETRRYKLVERLKERELKESLNATKVIRINKNEQ